MISDGLVTFTDFTKRNPQTIRSILQGITKIHPHKTCHMSNYIYSTLFKLLEREPNGRSKEKN